MKWFFLSVACAFFTATAASFSKLLLRKNNVFFVGWVQFAFSLPILLALLYIYRPGLCFGPNFWKTVAVLLPFELTAFLIYLKALKLSPLSLTIPFLGLTPVFSILFSYILLKESPNFSGITGVALVSAGAYLLNANTIKGGVLEPIKNIYKEKGSALMVIVAFIYSITSVLGKKAVLLSNPLSFAVVYYTIFFMILTPWVFLKERPSTLRQSRGLQTSGVKPSKIKFEKEDALLSLALGVSFTIALLLHFNAIILTKVPYMISVKRTSLLLSVFYGALIFKEKNIKHRLLGSSIMICGVVVLSSAQ